MPLDMGSCMVTYTHPSDHEKVGQKAAERLQADFGISNACSRWVARYSATRGDGGHWAVAGRPWRPQIGKLIAK